MEQLFSQTLNPNLPMEELEAMATEFRNDYNQRHFVRNETFKEAAQKITGECRGLWWLLGTCCREKRSPQQAHPAVGVFVLVGLLHRPLALVSAAHCGAP